VVSEGTVLTHIGQIVAAFWYREDRKGWDKSRVVHRPHLALSGISSVAFGSSVGVRGI
jgi:hypothetical protein